MKRSKPRQHKRRLPSGRVITVNKGRNKVSRKRIYYHGTKKKHLKNILKKGIFPANDDGYAYLSHTPFIATQYAEKGSEGAHTKRFVKKIKHFPKSDGTKKSMKKFMDAYNSAGDNSPGVILMVDLSDSELGSHIEQDSGLEVVHKGRISPKKIKNWRLVNNIK